VISWSELHVCDSIGSGPDHIACDEKRQAAKQLASLRG